MFGEEENINMYIKKHSQTQTSDLIKKWGEQDLKGQFVPPHSNIKDEYANFKIVYLLMFL